MALFGITKIDYCKANALAFSGAYNQFYGVASEPTNTFTNICDVVKQRATLSIEQQVVSKEVLYTCRLVFVTDTDPLLASDYYAFVVTTNAGERILIGAQNRPRTIVTTAQNVAATAGDLTAYTTTVEWQTNYRPLRLPVTVTPVTDTRVFDICCGQIAQPVAPDTRQFDICCGQIVGQEPPPPPPPTDVAVAVVSGLETIRYEKSYDGKRLYYQSAPYELVIAYAELQNIVVLRINNHNEGSYYGSDITAIQWNEQYLPTAKTWITDNNLRVGYYTGSNQTGDWHLIYWYFENGSGYEDWCYYDGKEIIPPTTPPTWPGHTFKGWATTQGGQPVTNFGTMPADDIAFYAVWE